MAKITGGELVVRTLLEAGVDRLFGLHGAHIDTIFQACLDHGLQIVDTRHEAAAGHAAEGYARVSARLGVALVTAGGGFTNVVTSIANAFLDRTPVLFLTGSGPLRDDETNTLQAGIDQVAIATPVTKWAHRVMRADQIPRLLAQAIRIASSAPRGPVLIDIPWDVLTETVENDSVPIPKIEPVLGAAPDPLALNATLEILATAKRPIIVVGSEASRGNAASALKAFVELTGIPAFADFEGLSLLSELGEFGGGLIQGLWGFKNHNSAPDAILMLGIRFGLNTAHGSGALLPLDARIVQVDPDGRELGRLQRVELGIQADARATLDALIQRARERAWPELQPWRRIVQERVRARYEHIAADCGKETKLHPFHASQVVARFIDANISVVADGALTYLWLSEVMSAAKPGDFLCHGYLGSMGVGFGTAVGSQVAGQMLGRRTLLVTGDGAVGYNISEFDTLVRKGLPVIVIIMNNKSWGATLHFQQLAVGRDRVTNTLLENGAYHEVACAFGADGYWVEDADGLELALRSALGKQKPACINVQVAVDPVPPEEKLIMGQDPF
jgi:acetolactate synthase I/II/III large subunit